MTSRIAPVLAVLVALPLASCAAADEGNDDKSGTDKPNAKGGSGGSGGALALGGSSSGGTGGSSKCGTGSAGPTPEIPGCSGSGNTGGDAGSGGSGSGASAGTGAGAGAGGGGAGGGGNGGQLCPPGQFVHAINPDGSLVCESITTTVFDSVHNECSTYFGERHECSGCSTPARWGRANDAQCVVGSGWPDNCGQHYLDGQLVRMAGVNPENGDVDTNDMFYMGFRCVSAGTPAAPHGGPCTGDELAVSIKNGSVVCASAKQAIGSYLSGNCAGYFGWNNDCDGCGAPPQKWGWANSGACANGVGQYGTCAPNSLGSDQVSLYGLNIDGEAGDDDMFYVGFHCDGAADATGATTGECPAGQFVIGIDAQGSAVCGSLAPAVEKVVQSSCWLHFGWRNDCKGCSLPPAKWGRVNHDGCSIGAGSNNTCTTAYLGGKTVRLLGINTDGDVGEDDKFFIGMKCY